MNNGIQPTSPGTGSFIQTLHTRRACPECGHDCKPRHTSPDGTLHYRCRNTLSHNECKFVDFTSTLLPQLTSLTSPTKGHSQ